MTKRELESVLTQWVGCVLLVLAVVSVPGVVVGALEACSWSNYGPHWMWNSVAGGWRAPMYLLLVVLRTGILAILGVYFVTRTRSIEETA